jgi:hypothetical protein
MRKEINTSRLCNDSPAKEKPLDQPTGFKLPCLSSGVATAAGKRYMPLAGLLAELVRKRVAAEPLPAVP